MVHQQNNQDEEERLAVWVAQTTALNLRQARTFVKDALAYGVSLDFIRSQLTQGVRCWELLAELDLVAELQQRLS